LTSVLIIIGVSIVFVLFLVSVRRQLQERAADKRATALARSGSSGETQHEESLRRRADVRAAHAARVKADSENLGSNAVQ
jgi:hypothetical protein